MRTKAEMTLDRRMQTRFALLTDPVGNVPGKRCYRIREGDGFPWRVLARAIVDLFRRDVPQEQVKALTLELHAWVDDLYEGTLERDDYPRKAA